MVSIPGFEELDLHPADCADEHELAAMLFGEDIVREAKMLALKDDLELIRQQRDF